MNPFLFFATVLVWGSTWYAITFQLGVVPESWSLVYRFAASTAILFAYCVAVRRNLRFPVRAHLWLVAMGLFNFSSNYYLVYLGTTHIASGLVAVVFSGLTLVNILSAVIFYRQRVEGRTLAGVALGIAGIALMFWPEVETFDFTDKAVVGLGICLAGTFLASFGNTVAATRIVSALPTVQVNAWGMLYGTLLLMAFAFVNGDPIRFDPSPGYVISLAYLAVFGTVLAFTAYFVLLRRIGLQRAGYIAIAFPVVALVISTVFEGFQWTGPAVAGMGLVVVGNALVLAQRKPRPAPQPAR